MRSTTNKHHGVPYSFGGSNNVESNISYVEIGEHNMFHKVTGHLPPDFLMRLNVIRMVGWGDSKGRVPTAEYFGDMFSVLTPDSQNSLYNRKAIRPVDSMTRAMQSQIALHVFNALGEESRYIHDAIKYLGGSKDYVERETRYRLETFMAFFRNSNPIRAINSYLTDTNEDGQLKWTKPLNPNIQADVKQISNTTRLEYVSSQWVARMIRILSGQKKEVEKRQETWQPSLHGYIQDIATHGFAHIQSTKRRHGKS